VSFLILQQSPRRSGCFVFFIILPIHHGHDLELSGSCQFSKSELPLNQYPQSAQFQLYGQVRNDDSRTVSSIATPDPDWWSENINLDHFSSEVHQEYQVAPACVSEETPGAYEVGTDSVPAAFQPASQSFGYSQESFDLNGLANYNVEIEQRASLARPDTANCMADTNSISPAQSDWNSSSSYSTPYPLFDLYNSTSRVSTPSGNETLYQGSQESGKTQIPVLRPIVCPHCSRPFSVEQRLRSHIQNSHKHSQHQNICDCCGKHFTLSKDLKRHLQTKLFACKCGSTYKRKDGLQRHIRNTIEKSRGGEHHAV